MKTKNRWVKRLGTILAACLLLQTAGLSGGLGTGIWQSDIAQASHNEGASALLVVKNASSLTGTDRAVQTRLANELGYEVAIMSSGLTEAVVNEFGVIVVSPTTSVIPVAVKQSAVPLVAARPSLYPMLGLTGNTEGTDYGELPSQTSIYIVEEAEEHPLAAGLSGTVVIHGTTTLGWGEPSAEAAIVATGVTSAQPVLFAYDVGAEMASSFIAPARRVALPWSSSMFSVTADGWSLFDAAVQWATELNPLTGRSITGFEVAGQLGPSVIDSSAHTVSFTMPAGSGLGAIVPNITLSEGAAIDPPSGASVDFTSGTVAYTVTADNGEQQIWQVTVRQEMPSGTEVELIRSGNVEAVYETIQEAVDAAQAGDTVLIREGQYYENIVIDGVMGTETAPFTIMGAPGETVIVNGADPGIASPNNGRWTPLGDGVYTATVPWTGDPEKALLTWASRIDGALLAAHYNLELFNTGARGDDKTYRAGSTVRIKLDNGADPNEVPLLIGISDGVFRIQDSQHIAIENMEIRGGGFAGVYMKGEAYSHIRLDRLTIRNSFRGISTDDEEDSGSHVTISNNLIANNWPADWRWDGYVDAGSSSNELLAPMRGHGIVMKASHSQIHHNEITGGWDGMQVQGEHIQIHHNTISNMKDDGVELESNNSAYLEFYENRLYDVFVGFSIVSDTPGPIYIYRNIFSTNKLSYFKPQTGETYRYGYSIKNGRDWGAGAENVKVYHNTFFDKRTNLFDGEATYDWNGFEYYNNIFYTEGIRDEKGTVENSQLGSNERYADGNRWNGNLYYSERSPRLFSDWNGRGYCLTLAECRVKSPEYETAGIQADPRFAALDKSNGANNDLMLEPDSPARDAGVLTVIEQGWPDSVGAGDGMPDIGRYELTGTAPAPGVPPTQPLQLQATEVTPYSVKLDWADHPEQGSLRGYNVYRGLTPDVTPTIGNRIATWVASSVYTDKLLLEQETDYYYVVTAVDSFGRNSVPSAAVLATPPADTEPPASPGSLIAGTNEEGHVLLDWQDSGEEDFVFYRLYRSEEPSFVPNVSNRIADSLTSSHYVDETAAAGTQYYYKIAAVDWNGFESAPAGIAQLSVSNEWRKAALLLVMSGNHTEADLAIKARLETLGYAVTIRNHDNLTGNEGDGFDLIYISATVYVSRISNLFNNAAVPLLNSDYGLHRDMRFVEAPLQGRTMHDQTQLVITDPVSELAGGLSGTVDATNGPVGFSYGEPPVDAIKIAVIPGTDHASIFGFEAGAEMALGHIAPARRLATFMQETTALKLTEAGWTLFDAGIGWLLGGVPNAPGEVEISLDGNASATLGWELETEDGAMDFVVYHNGSIVDDLHVQKNGDRFETVIGPLASGQTHTFVVRAVGSSGNASAQSEPVSIFDLGC
ncbi:right-handed parallel beta-helix repeat-containing protein [Paenibacillus sp. MY03]|uniref:right-handed parallel beta-helix repeat-containing protein n=1 Tax=Paenibacillus sp. MY03 TaxID=302980 RepID=UPI0015C62F88|nr:right-handed parallel beta-helix repeat-containing protein [Paenibacillus sp. MY03]